jgi:2-oxoglutarate dehydrogenase complex dehydrogenase (E1) component-like enzyme
LAEKLVTSRLDESMVENPAWLELTLPETFNGVPLESIAHATPIRLQIAPGPNVKKLIFCSGKVKYDILDAREAAGLKEYGACLGWSHRSALS